MEIRLLKYFWTVAQERNISRAAKILNITQPTLSRQMRDLEEDVGVSLFHREKNQLTLTQEGLLLKERSEEILILDAKLEQIFSEQRNEQLSGYVTIGCVEADNSDTVAMMLEELISDYPQVSFNLVTGIGEDIMDRLEKGILDLAVLLEPICLNDVETLRLPREEKWGFLLSKEMFIAQKKEITSEDIKGLPILCSSRLEVQQLLVEWSNIPINKLNLLGHFNLIYNVFSLIENKIGAALTIEGAVAHRNLSETVFLPLSPAVKTNCVLVWKKRVQTPVVQELINRFNYAFQA